jgi:uncharacterized membrane protein
MGLLPLYVLLAILFAAAAWHAARAGRRRNDVVYWALLAALFAFGDLVPAELVGAGVIALALAAGLGKVGRTARGEPHARVAPRIDIGDRVFAPALAIPLVTVALVFAFKALTIDGAPLFDAQQATLFALGAACIVAFGIALVTTRATVRQGLEAGSDLLDAVGWAPLLPLMLAMLGAVFVQAHVGESIAELVARAIPVESRLACIVAYGLGMVLFTAIMGNAFAAFPVMTAGIALPLLVAKHGAAPAPLAALGMLTGYCGTLLTPMAANFNLIPVALLELDDDWAVIKAQAPTGLALMVVNIALMVVLV